MVGKTSGQYKGILLYLILTLLFFILYISPILIFSWSLNDRYKLINQSEKYFSEGKYNEAINAAEKYYCQIVIPKQNVSPFFFMKHMYENSKLFERNSNIKCYQALTNLAYCLKSKGVDIDRAESLFLESIKFCKTKFTNSPEYLLFPTSGCFNIYLARGDNKKIDSCYYEISNLLTKLNQYDASYKAQSLMLYATFSEKNGNIKQAIKLRREALAVYHSQGKDIWGSTAYSQILLKVISGYLINLELKEASFLLDECEELLKDKHEKTIYRSLLFIKAQYLELNNQLVEAEETLEIAVNLTLKNSGTKNEDFLAGNFVLASFYFRQHNIARAKAIFDKLLKINESVKNSGNLYNAILLGSALTDSESLNFKDASFKAKNIENYLFKQFDTNFAFLPEDDKENLVFRIESQIDQLNSIHIKVGDSLQICRLYDNILATKAIALESNRFIRNIISQNDRSDLLSRYNNLAKRRQETNGSNLSITDISLVNDSIRKAEADLLSSFSTLPNFNENKVNTINWTEVKAVLESDQVAVEFIKVPINPIYPNDYYYFALVIRPNSNKPSIIKLCSEIEIESILKQKGKSEEELVNTIYTGNSLNRLYDLIWSPLNTYLIGTSKVYVSLSGILHKISVPVLTVNEMYDVEVLSSTRKLVLNRKRNAKRTNSNAILYGNIDYDNASITNKSSIRSSETFIKTNYNSLPGTKNEIDAIAEILSIKNIHTVKIVKSDATSESFQNIGINQPNILHIATHGFYTPPGPNIKFSDNYDGNCIFDNPLFRSGLIFAGANLQSSHSEYSNGRLTSYDISKLNLSSVDLLVLSACETGLGEIKGDEGVYGLQRAFALAGVESIVVSLWKIPDYETSILMKKFYQYYASGRYSKQKCLKLAQVYIRDNIKRTPYYWGAFKLVE